MSPLRLSMLAFRFVAAIAADFFTPDTPLFHVIVIFISLRYFRRRHIFTPSAGFHGFQPLAALRHYQPPFLRFHFTRFQSYDSFIVFIDVAISLAAPIRASAYAGRHA
jgi:hypothetical protein